jgi:hydroxymethylpyrimidine/phosphomethylpyrimidine kinase
MRTALTIAGSDSSGGAGIQADLKTFAAFGVYGTCAVTAITAQSTTGITEMSAISADLVTAQIEAVAGDIEIHATKIGMLATAAIVEAVAAAIEELELPLVVLDPVMVATSGRRLLDEDGVKTMCAELIPRAFLITPNLPEAEVLSGITIASADDMAEAARRIHGIGGASVLITGGHMPGHAIADLLFDGRTFSEFSVPRIEARQTHGTGCAHASALAACLALEMTLHEAARRAQLYVAGAIRHGIAIGHGQSQLDHFWETRPART